MREEVLIFIASLRVCRYKHGVIQNLLSPDLLRNVRSEIISNIHFTPKETDIYKIHQSGDLANLDGLDDASLNRLPSLIEIRNSMYSQAFRDYLSTVTGCGPLSGSKTDMALNIYVPGCHLLCHDDVIGTRRASYILYLTDPDLPWKQEWGGALRLYSTEKVLDANGEKTSIPKPDPDVYIPPAFNQLSFFTVQPGESFHDVEEVYPSEDPQDRDGSEKRIRMAISGWYHIPQDGEEGYIEGLADELAEKSSLAQLQGRGNLHEYPKPAPVPYEGDNDVGLDEAAASSDEHLPLSQEDLDFLLKYIAPTYLTPDTIDSMSSTFIKDCSLSLNGILAPKFAAVLQEYVQSQDIQTLPASTADISASTSWQIARPPYLQRYLYQRHSDTTPASPLQEIIDILMPSNAFRKWLQLVSGQVIRSRDVLARRFRRGHDYTLAQEYDKEAPRIELCVAVTPSPGWGPEDSEPTNTNGNEDPGSRTGGVRADRNTKSRAQGEPDAERCDPGTGGYILYMAGDEPDGGSDGGSDHGLEIPADLSTGGRATQAKKAEKSKADPAIYQAQDDDDDGLLFSMAAGWNQLGIVLRDCGTMRFVKYVSRQAKGDRWDVWGEFEVEEQESDNEDDGNDDNNALDGDAETDSGSQPDLSIDSNSEGSDDSLDGADVDGNKRRQ